MSLREPFSLINFVIVSLQKAATIIRIKIVIIIIIIIIILIMIIIITATTTN